MSSFRKLLLLAIAVLLGIGVPSCILLNKHRARVAPQELATILPQIASITLYDLHINNSHTATSLGSAISATFPVDVFMRAASSAQHHPDAGLWKGSSLAILTLRDGTQRRAHFSYYGGFFKLEGIIGHFVVPSAAGFDDAFNRFIHEHFVPKRLDRNRTRSRLNAKD